MRRIAWGVVAACAATCGGTVRGKTTMGEPCTPQVQSDPSFAFDARSVYYETHSPKCPSTVCLVNHFQGRVGEPYGDKTTKPQCADRQEGAAVYCSCRCANAGGRTDDGADYCACAGGFVCTPLVASIGTKDDESGSYCIKAGTEWSAASSCAEICDAAARPCP